jgi:hypothetical protein
VARSPAPTHRRRSWSTHGLLDAHAPGCLYARVDAVVAADRFVLMEIELVEPSLYFEHHPPAATAFALAIRRIT